MPGRSITDNVLLAFETIHYMKQKKSGTDGDVALKLDISKAYDRVDWKYCNIVYIRGGSMRSLLNGSCFVSLQSNIRSVLMAKI